ncbi:hypothetical protein FACS1894102_7000 [Spirochaetia bacterium]|nr:hypothetical protein FACS1894102_7000 [Spirochaetia bacterium]
MRIIKFFTPIWLAVLFYAFSSIVVGAMGLNAYKQLSGEHEKQLANLQNLKNKTEELQGIQEALRYDDDTIAVYARDQGLAKSDERIIRIVGLDGKHKEKLDSGEVINIAELDTVDDKTLRIISVVIAIFMYVCVGIVSLINMLSRISD